MPAPFQRVRIEALGYAVPPHRVTSTSIEDELAPTYKRLGIPAGCIEMLVGVKARRFCDEGTPIDKLAGDVARRLLDDHGGVDRWRRHLGAVISTSVCKDFIEPSVASLVRGSLALAPECEAIDVGNACLGFMNGMELASQWIELGKCEAVLVVDGESSRNVVRKTIARLLEPASTMADFKEALPTLTLGSGAVAMLLVHESLASTNHRVTSAVALGDPASSTICLGTADWMKTDAAKLLANGVDLAMRTWGKAGERLGWTRDNVAHFIAHQVGATHVATLFKKLDLSLDKAFLTYPELGNIGPAAVPLTLGMAVDDGRVKDGDRIALMGIGSGLSCMMMEVLW
jgi:3-oxoacyl-[acyl-carrier-protein] synthase III